jgi:hypothetical protein
MVDTDLINSFKIITDHSYATRQKIYAASLEDLFGRDNIRTSEIHAKFTLIKNDSWNIVIRTSMNLNANKTCENFEIDDSKEVYDFYNNFIDYTFLNMEIGFVESSSKVNDCVSKFFAKNEKKVDGWDSDISWNANNDFAF